MNNKNKIRLPLIMMAVMLAISGIESKAQDWPQWRGANRDGVAKATNINLDWSAKKPPLAWTFRQAGSGYSAPVVVGTTLYCQGAADGSDFAFALDTQTGALKWKQNLGAYYTCSDNRGDGPRGSVTVDGDKLYLIRGGGQIHCLSAADGKMLWQKDFAKDFNGKLMSRWGHSESPLVDGNIVICTPGGEGGYIVALDKNSGALVWRTKELTGDAAHSSAIIVDIDGIRQYVQQTNKGVTGISAKDGKMLWKVDIPQYKIAVIPTPVTNNNFVYVTNGYNGGSTCIRLTKEGNGVKADTVYTSSPALSNPHGGVVLVNGYIYGVTDRQGFVCQDFKTGESVWRERSQGVVNGVTVAVNDRLILLNETDGLIVVVAASPAGWKEFGRMEFPERTKLQNRNNQVWTHPIVANSKLYLRDHDLLFCFDLK